MGEGGGDIPKYMVSCKIDLLRCFNLKGGTSMWAVSGPPCALCGLLSGAEWC